jgi:hypothetical protein
MPHHPKAPSGSPVFRIAAAGALRGYAFRSLDAGEGGTVGIGAGGAAGVCFIVGGFCSGLYCCSGFAYCA